MSTRTIPTVFGSFFYFSLVIQWLWVLVLFVPPLLENQTVKNFVVPEQTARPETVTPLFDPDSLPIVIIASIVTVLVLGVTIVVLAKLPLAVVRASKKSVETVAETFVPVAAHHKKLPVKQRRILTAKLKLTVKLLFTLLAFVVLPISYLVPITLAPEIILAVGAVLAGFSLLWIGLQYASAKLLKIPFERVI